MCSVSFSFSCLSFCFCVLLLSILYVFEPFHDENRPHPGNRIERERSGPTWPNQKLTGVKFGWPWSLTGAHLGPLRRNFRRTQASWLQLGAQLEPSWGPKLCNAEVASAVCITWLQFRVHLDGPTSAQHGHLAPTSCPARRKTAQLGAKLGPTWPNPSQLCGLSATR